jgi:tRNA-(ms[2]io[6]A)-hydroxylase
MNHYVDEPRHCIETLPIMPAADDQPLELWPLRYTTPASWAVHALAQPVALLNDHAHLEKKAAANALDLLPRWPDRDPPEHWSAALAAVARDETEHLALVLRHLSNRGGLLTKSHRNPYAAELRSLVRLATRDELLDRLLVSALIEARSCERFERLQEALDANPQEPALAKLYRGLAASERGHHRLFLELASSLNLPDDALPQRWSFMLDQEAIIIARQPAGPAMHAGA